MNLTHNYFYKITNIINGKYYYGIHSTDNLEDGYMGSGTVIRNAIKKYGKENFTKEIIVDFETRIEAILFEKNNITKIQVESKECYNLQVGGSFLYKKPTTEETKKKQRKAKAGDKAPMYGKTGAPHPFFGKNHKKESIQKIKDSNIGVKNPMYSRKHTDASCGKRR